MAHTQAQLRQIAKDAAIFDAIVSERLVQDLKWGEATKRGLPLTVWLAVLTEEVGEVAQDILKHRRDTLRAELVQVAAIAVATLECLDGAPWGVDDADAG